MPFTECQDLVFQAWPGWQRKGGGQWEARGLQEGEWRDAPQPELLGFREAGSSSSQLLPWTWAASPGPMQANKILWLFTIFHPSSQDQQVPLRSPPIPTVPPTCLQCF